MPVSPIRFVSPLGSVDEGIEEVDWRRDSEIAIHRGVDVVPVRVISVQTNPGAQHRCEWLEATIGAPQNVHHVFSVSRCVEVAAGNTKRAHVLAQGTQRFDRAPSFRHANHLVLKHEVNEVAVERGASDRSDLSHTLHDAAAVLDSLEHR